MEVFPHIHLLIVESGSVRPHEIADPGREQRIELRLREDGVLRDPLMVGGVPGFDGYVLLDGTNRQRALLALNLPYVMVQVVDYTQEYEVALRTWCHATDLPLDSLAGSASAVIGVEVEPLPPLAITDSLRTPATLAVLAGADGQYEIRRTSTPQAPRAAQLRQLVDLYESRMTRVDCAPEAVEERAETMGSDENGLQTLIAFPPFSRSQVVTMAARDVRIPAGITRHIIQCGRALRVNLPLALLDGSTDLNEANAALRGHVERLQPRLYREPTVLFDS